MFTNTQCMFILGISLNVMVVQLHTFILNVFTTYCVDKPYSKCGCN